MSIKPGTLCYVIRSPVYSEWVGRIVTTVGWPSEMVGRKPDGEMVAGLGVEVAADWLPPSSLGWIVRPEFLRPIAGPGIADEVEREKEAAR